MGNFIEDFIKQNENVFHFRKQVMSDFKSADNNLDRIKDFLMECNYNPAVGVEFACLLQVLDKPYNFSDFELADISRLFQSLIKLEPGHVDAYLEAAHFEWAVMDNSQAAVAVANEGIKRATEKIKELQSLLLSIEQN
ncbi:MAG: hypothetical protein EOP06_05050 [Proteobacteria bacterium]|nr:MAG: hypothetical protein EOP06_05050 [Pseudomonadota bacterium]